MDFMPGMLMDSESAGVAAELIPDGLVAADADGRILFLNTRATRILGRPREELVGADIREAVDLQDSDGTSWWAVTDPWGGLRIRTGHREKLLMLRDSGREVLVTAKYLRPGRNQPVNRVNILMRDAMYRRRAEAENAAVISTVAHELRSPLTSVKGFSSTLLRRWDRFTDDQKRLMLETIEADADRVTRLITELLDVSRIDSGRLQIRPLPIDVSAVFHRHVERAVASGAERDRFAIEVVRRAPRGLGRPRPARPDPRRTSSRTPSGTARAWSPWRPSRRPTAARRPSRPRVTTPASTCSSPTRARASRADHRNLVFSRFWHGSGRGSTGLGLYVVKGLVEAHGGRVQVEEGADRWRPVPDQPALRAARLPRLSRPSVETGLRRCRYGASGWRGEHTSCSDLPRLRARSHRCTEGHPPTPLRASPPPHRAAYPPARSARPEGRTRTPGRIRAAHRLSDAPPSVCRADEPTSRVEDMSGPNKQYDPVEVAALDPAEVEQAVADAQQAIAAAVDLDELKAARLAHQGEKSPLALANREIGALPPSAKAEAGKRVGQARGQVSPGAGRPAGRARGRPRPSASSSRRPST